MAASRIGPYELLAPIGRGGMGTVYRARCPAGDEVALKVLHRNTSETLARFDREQRLQGALSEADGFVPLLDADLSGETPYLVMPLLTGGTLRDRLGHGALPLGGTVALGATLALALGRAHARGIVHRDLKPENVLFTAKGLALVADLGLAKHFASDTPGASRSVTLSREGMLRGTAGYMSPEQMRDARSVSPSADVFALGAILYECLTGSPAFQADTVLELIRKVDAGERAPIRSLRRDAPPWLVSVIDRALEVDPARRFPDGVALGRALTAGPGSLRSTPLLVAGLLLLVVVASIAAFVATRHASAPPATATPSVPTRAPETVPAPKADEARPRDSERAHVRLERAKALMARRDYRAALVELTEALALDDRLVVAWATRARAKGELGDYAGSLADSTRAIELDPRFAPAWFNRGLSKHRNGDTSGALADYDKALELDPRLDNAWNNRAALRQATGDFKGAVADATRAIELAPEAAEGWMNRGIVRAQLEDAKGALEDLTRAIELDPGNASAWANRAAVRQTLGENDLALADGAKALAIDPRDTGALCARAYALSNKGDSSAAIAEVTKAIEVAPSKPTLWRLRGTFRATAGDYKGAIADANELVRLAPDAVGWNARGWYRALAGDLEGAIADTTKAIELDPRFASARHTRGYARAKAGDHARAVDDFTKAIELDPKSDLYLRDRGASREATGDRAGAIADYTRVLEIAPGGPRAESARSALSRLRSP